MFEEKFSIKERKLHYIATHILTSMVDCQEEQANSSSPKNEKIKLYTLSFKLLVVKHAKMSSTGAAEQKFRVDRKRIRVDTK